MTLMPLTPVEERVAQLIPGYRQLMDLGVKFYPVNSDKSPAVPGRLSHAATTDPTTVQYWLDYCHHRGIAGRIGRGARLLVLDTEHPMKHPDRVGPDGEL